MHVLLLHQHYNSPSSGGPLRSYFIAKALKEKGIDVTILTAGNKGKESEDTSQGFRVVVFSIAYDNSFGFLKRIQSFYQFAKRCIQFAGQHHHQFSLCYAISTPLSVGWAARQIQRKYGLPYIFEVGDLWPDAPIALGFIKASFIVNRLYALERSIYKEAKHVIALSPPIAESIALKISKNKIGIIPNMSDVDFFAQKNTNVDRDELKGLSGKLVMVYAGALGFANGLDYLMDGMKLCQDRGINIHLFIAGAGAYREHLERRARLENINNITFLLMQDRDSYRELMQVVDVSFICYRHVKILETGSPNKFFDALAAGKAVMLNFSGWIRDLVEAHQCGLWVNPLSPMVFAEKVQYLINNPEQLKTMKQNARTLSQSFSKKELCEEVVQLVKANALPEAGA